MEARYVWCHVCQEDVQVDTPEVLLSFSPQGWTLYPSGALDLGWPADVFVDVAHLKCGATYRVLCSTMWQDGPDGESYLDGPCATIELTSHSDEVRDYFTTDEYPEWRPTYATVLTAYKEARQRLKNYLANPMIEVEDPQSESEGDEA